MLIDHEPKTNKQNKILFLAIILSIIFGFASGGLASYLISQQANFSHIDNVPEQTRQTVNLIEESATIDVVKNASPSVVSIIISKDSKDIYQNQQPFFNDFFGFNFPQIQQQTPQVPEGKQEIGGGTGFIVSQDGMIITNKHVVMDDTATYEVITADGDKYDAEVMAKDTINDLAIIKIDAHDLKPLTLGDSDNIEIGQTVIAIGNVLSEFRNTVTKGVISGINRKIEAGGSNGFSETIEEAIQTDAAINPGNSGGPLLNVKGEVIGINTAVSNSGQSVGFAIPINEAKKVIDSIEKYGKIVRPFLGVRYMMINEQNAKLNNLPVDYGALIIRGSNNEIPVVPGSAADKAGIVENDIILEVNGQKIDEDHSLVRELSKYNPGDEVELKVYHDGDEKTVKVKLEERDGNSNS